MREGFVYVNDNVFQSLFAISAEEQQRGLMYIEPPTPIMSFPYARAQINKFWMRSTPSPLDIVFCYQNKVSQLHCGEPYSTAMIGDDKLSDLIIEFPRGYIDQTNIKIGHSAGLISPTIEEIKKLFFHF